MRDIALTEDQKKEFDTPLLQAFAKDYLAFRHSRPSTSKRKLFRYFTPLDMKDMPDDDVIYGAHREKSYMELLGSFKACLMANEFDKLMTGKSSHWHSRTIPDLVILRSWIDGKEKIING